MSFRLKKLVIHEGCKYLKTLQPNTYDFLDSNSIDGFYGKNIEITAIVGKNGSGKSSLLEIIFRMMNNISVFIAHGYDVMHRVNNIFVAGIKSDLYYEINGTDCLIECRDTSIALSYSDKKWRFGDVNEEFRNYLNGNSMLIKDKIEMCKYLFFTLISNYSVQAYVDEDYITDTTCNLNTDGSLSENQSNGNAWIHFVFHKNDGYMSPININPFRDNGKIDMLKEEKLQRQRMEFLLLHYHKKKKEFIQGYTLSKIIYRFDWQKLYNKFSKIDVDNPTEKQKKEEWKGQVSLFKGCLSAGNSIAKSILSAIGIQHLNLNNDMLIYAYLYITYKVLSIARTYPSYSRYSNIANIDLAFIQGNEEQRIQATMLAKDVRTDHSHIANKVFQAINFIKMVESGFECDEEKQFTWEIYNENRIKDELNQSTAIENEIRCLPPSFFDYKIYVHPKGENKELPIEHMSAGERQLYYILSTLIYHILNIKSVDTRRVHYRDVAIILDEVELGFHPDLQRKFINFIIETFERLSLNTFIRFHFIITTHSPFMLSDIRKNNILYLEKGYKIDKEKLLNPFGANINDILAQSFFLEDGFTGDFAKNKILSLLNWLSKNNIKGWDIDTAKQLIESLDEPIIKRHFEYLLSLKNNK